MSKKGKLIFTRHAFDRLNERTKLTAEEVTNIFDKGIMLNIGSKPGIQRDHILFYSKLDKDFFVAIQDSNSGTVVTILPLEYHNNLAWKVPDKDLNKALEKWNKYENLHITNSSSFVISIHYLDGNRFKINRLLKVTIDKVIDKVDDIFNLEEVMDPLRNKLKELKITTNEETEISVRITDKGEFTFFNFNKLIGEKL